MKIMYTDNLEQFINKIPGPNGTFTVAPQEGTETTEIFKTNFLSLGELAKINKIQGNEKGIGLLDLFKRPLSYLPISKYSLEISTWKILALAIAVLPVLVIKALFYGSASAIVERDVTVNKVKIEASEDQTGKMSIETKKIQPFYLKLFSAASQTSTI